MIKGLRFRYSTAFVLCLAASKTASKMKVTENKGNPRPKITKVTKNEGTEKMKVSYLRFLTPMGM